jgi:hypothetical protein
MKENIKSLSGMEMGYKFSKERKKVKIGNQKNGENF